MVIYSIEKETYVEISKQEAFLLFFMSNLDVFLQNILVWTKPLSSEVQISRQFFHPPYLAYATSGLAWRTTLFCLSSRQASLHVEM